MLHHIFKIHFIRIHIFQLKMNEIFFRVYSVHSICFAMLKIRTCPKSECTYFLKTKKSSFVRLSKVRAGLFGPLHLKASITLFKNQSALPLSNIFKRIVLADRYVYELFDQKTPKFCYVRVSVAHCVWKIGSFWDILGFVQSLYPKMWGHFV